MTELREKLARFLCEEHNVRWRIGPLWHDIGIQKRQEWLEDADRYVAHLAERGLMISEHDRA